MSAGAAAFDGTAVVRVELVDRITAFDFQQLLSLMESVYFADLWLELAEQSDFGHAFPDFYTPTDQETLWIEQVEIGSPNKLSLRGKAKHVTAVVAVLTGLLGLPHAYVEVVKGIAETQKMELESESLKLDIADKAQRLYNEGKISSEALKHKLEVAEMAKPGSPASQATTIVSGAPVLTIKSH
jgi:hypothetical protein